LGPGRDEITMRVWERGVGETQACGSGACAAAAAVHAWGRVGTKGTVHQSGGDAEAELSADTVILAGPTPVTATRQRPAARTPAPATYVGKGKASEPRDLSNAVDADTVVFDDELSPAQSRNLEKILGRTAIDRTAVILDIFAQNARTPEGRAQVELAQLRYRLPRLRGRGKALSQQAGGIGTRGPGETQLEVDRRRLLRRVTKREAELAQLLPTRLTPRKALQRSR